MNAGMWKLCFNSLNVKALVSLISACKGSIRNGHHLRGKPPGVARTLQQRLEDSNFKHPELCCKVDIGLPALQRSRSKIFKTRMQTIKGNRTNAELEKLSREKKLLINLDDVRKNWLETDGPYHVKVIAEHFGIFKHLFRDAYFVPSVPLQVLYNCERGTLPVYCGNIIKPHDAANEPTILYNANEDSLWTLILTNPDGHLIRKDSEYVHWFIGNIPGNNICKGEIVLDYLQPFPPKGTGYHRHVFVLYKQTRKIDFSSISKEKGLDLEQRTFSTFDFYRERQDCITPAGLSFFQADWDESLTDFFHNTLNMKEPIFEYNFPLPYIRRQEWFALRKPFNLYMDKYREPKQINKEFLIKKLKNVHPFKSSPPPLPYPNAQYFEGYVPTWLKLEMKKERSKWGRINEI